MTSKGLRAWVAVLFCAASCCTDFLRSACVYAADHALPAPDRLIPLSQRYDEPTLRGIKVDPSDPFKLTFVYDKGSDGKIDDAAAKELAQYFFSALVIPTKDLWVNLSPFEKDRVIEDAVAQTEIGDVFLAQDYLLKQLSSSLTDPNTDLGKEYWSSVGMNDSLPVQGEEPSTENLNKIWITPGEIKVYSDATTTMITDAALDVQTEHDYLASKESAVTVGANNHSPALGVDTATKNVLLPAILKDVNEGKNFAPLRQMMHAIILAQLFKSKYGSSVYAALIDSGKDDGLTSGDPAMKIDVFEKYATSFQNGVYRTTAKVKDASGRKAKREYFCGGVSSAITHVVTVPQENVRPATVMYDVRVRVEYRHEISVDYRDEKDATYFGDMYDAFTDMVDAVNDFVSGDDEEPLGGFFDDDDDAVDTLLAPGEAEGRPRLTPRQDFMQRMLDDMQARDISTRPSFMTQARLDELRYLLDTYIATNDISDAQEFMIILNGGDFLKRSGVELSDRPISKTGSALVNGDVRNGGIDLTGIAERIVLAGAGDPWGGRRIVPAEVPLITGVTLAIEGTARPFTFTAQ